MNSLRTVSRVVRVPSARQLAGQGLTQTRRLTSTTSSEFPDKRDAAVHDAIMDKLWGAGTTQSGSVTTTNTTASSNPASTEAPAQSVFGAADSPSEPARL